MPFKVQSVLFAEDHWTEARARNWLKKHHYKSTGKIHKTDHYLRFRQYPPDEFRKRRFFTQEISDGTIKLILGEKKSKKAIVAASKSK